ncbi:hypothetical protein TBLA_0B09580 [Henningerozyma blattae CBS 6284]|uniref:Peptide chain release factor 1, mitochondrial n=1 Tax=Henningerozyma blattae (strain ATCC 34711 / CBS 6284 / DSM 70876 / NBRC 10599 / NRRL Y-10934 / UCD 77-7) TaxID=1071380 RepID=I2H073_HENB6|nr:hypothetical protein TBLA_0B09580 [Tetrapisispora blattae CBS 6284]CCH59775.1 hypothetical protein TBLA_0B09580 [Tetrapisispora blattae CBS 6284]
MYKYLSKNSYLRTYTRLIRYQHNLSSFQNYKIHPRLLTLAEEKCHNESDNISSMSNTQMPKINFVQLKYLTNAYKTQLQELRELKDIIGNEPSLADDAIIEYEQLMQQFQHTSDSLLHALIPEDTTSSRPCLLEIRPGVGGIEAQLFAGELLEMYCGYAVKHNWKYHIAEKNTNEMGNITWAVLKIDQPNSFGKMKYEAGVHRVQRIPASESKGRTHTSTAAIVVRPIIKELYNKNASSLVKLNDVRVDVMRARGKGGQHVNTTDSAVRLTHLPTGITVSMQDERSQNRNKARAFEILEQRLQEREISAKKQDLRDTRKSQVPTIERSEKIRTYNFHQNRVTDHRCNFQTHDLDNVMTGESLDKLIEAMEKYELDQKISDLIGHI